MTDATLTKDDRVHYYAGFPGKALCMGNDTPLLTHSNTRTENVTCDACKELLDNSATKEELVPRDPWFKDDRTWRLVRLLIECRDALPAISLAAARLHGLDLSLADRIEQEIEPWRADPDSPDAI